jgi:PASTA domain
MRRIYPTHGTSPATARTAVVRNIMGAAVAKYGGDAFTAPATSLVRGSAISVPDLTGQTVEHARDALGAIGLRCEEGGVQDGDEPAGTIHATSPGSGHSVYRGDTITVYPSTGPKPKPTPIPGSRANADAH